ncbi:MAG: D-alanine glycine permease, partial [Arsenicicoccus sp.]
FTVAGCILNFGEVLAFADNFLFVCAFVNLLGVYFLLPVIKREMNEYLADRKSGKLLELGKLDADKEIPVREVAEANQVRDETGQNRLAGDPDDDGFGRGGTTVPRDRR